MGTKKITKIIKGAKPSPTMLVDGFKMLITAHRDYKETVEREKTKREVIKAEKEVFIKKINEQKEIIKNYFELTFDERKENFNKLFDALDKGIESGNDMVIDKTLSSIIELAKESPLKKIKELVSDFKNDDVKEIEI